MKHTSLPWSINTKALGLIESESAHRSCASASSYSDGSESAHEENKANAAFIVKACNSHEKLLGALIDLSLAMYGIYDWSSKTGKIDSREDVIIRAEEAIKEAQE